MTTPDPAKFRVGDAEREDAMRALGEHMSGGRLDLDEYAERTAQVTAARTWSELTALFTDLPEPHPSFPAAEAAAAAGRRATEDSDRADKPGWSPKSGAERAARSADAVRARLAHAGLATRIAGGALIAIGIFSVGMVLLTILPMMLIGAVVLWLLFGVAGHGHGRRHWANSSRANANWSNSNSDWSRHMHAARHEMRDARRRARAEYYGYRRGW